MLRVTIKFSSRQSVWGVGKLSTCEESCESIVVCHQFWNKIEDTILKVIITIFGKFVFLNRFCKFVIDIWSYVIHFMCVNLCSICFLSFLLSNFEFDRRVENVFQALLTEVLATRIALQTKLADRQDGTYNLFANHTKKINFWIFDSDSQNYKNFWIQYPSTIARVNLLDLVRSNSKFVFQFASLHFSQFLRFTNSFTFDRTFDRESVYRVEFSLSVFFFSRTTHINISRHTHIIRKLAIIFA